MTKIRNSPLYRLRERVAKPGEGKKIYLTKDSIMPSKKTSSTSTSADKQELVKFNDMAAQWWDENGPMKPLHDINPARMQFIEELTPLENKTILDVGCGGGILSESMAKAGAKVTGIDMAKDVLTVAKLHRHEKKLDINYQYQDVVELAKTSPASYDIVTCMELLEHVPEPDNIIAACSKLLKPEGFIFFSTINRNLKSFALAIVGAEYLLGLLPKGTHEYAKFIRIHELDAWARAADLTLASLKGIAYNPITKNFSLGCDTDVNYLACYKKEI